MIRRQHRRRWLTATLALGALAVAMSTTMPAPAEAHDRGGRRGWDRWDDWGGHRHHDRHRGWGNGWGGFFYAPQPRYIYPQPYAYQPYAYQPYVYAPPPPRYYSAPPSLDFNFRF
jgi:hypothetical protein